ncbi:putative cell segregation machinery component [Suhomyces tanzawaensis NRRL Y-17324]|uniref:Putative cell segregation machinery component n=1 Tax=Suhomyces tanzawaensis NRRL Y-17324 TaxID=984487 RepID=A0A1E4SMY8_9ASCO|nr:putative cell segregation machinery component [Suhomyces tanzawaensis NRRL Y-17324]ODV80883.1 putative cell segregation machinery component [Suhomyces tanzawaensis NRRL Y-17324]
MVHKKEERNVKNVLPNKYIPVLSPKVLRNVISRLPKSSLLELMYVWPKLVNTQPHLDKENSRHSQATYSSKVSQEAKELKRNLKVPKRKIVEKILFEYWSKGLNLLQLAQVDCQLIIDRPNSYYWIKSTVRDSNDKEVCLLLAPQMFLERLAAELSALYLTYIYVCRHPRFPLILVRVQVFDLQPINSTLNSSRPHIASHKPYFVAIPLNSPHLIHSPGDDMVTNIVLQTVEYCLPQSANNLVRLETNPHQKPLRSLESMHIFNGNSRFGNSMGAWTPYADGTVDLLPFGELEKHTSLNPKQTSSVPSDDDPSKSMLKKIANLRFKGSQDGVLKSSRLYDDNKPIRKLTIKSIAHDSESEAESGNEDEFESNEYSSFAPVQHTEFIIREKVKIEHENCSNIKIAFSGLDVFAGLHELSVTTAEENKMVLNALKIPNYLTGEEGSSNGVIHNGEFTKTS